MNDNLAMVDPKVKGFIIELIRDRRYEMFYIFIENILLIYVGFNIIKNISAFNGYFSLHIFLEMLFPLIIYLIISKLTEGAKAKIKKKRDKLKNILMNDICHCNHKCRCRPELLQFLKKSQLL